ncbi:hypothetical protein COJ60_24755 [Bacillus cereus]|nr:hypothetical protein TU49_18045 [Bacillus cereus]PNS33237.1 hypothetical protein C1640_07980 [Bacillus sp. AKBS9]QHH86242.1 hypothetical protein FPL02_22600 [Bacillus paranthracis]KMP44276.1 hypothetical protein TU55_15360 [Bacillus cereus]KMP67752.1 hypothetical protein TU61_08980 [Bacillus cereus]
MLRVKPNNSGGDELPSVGRLNAFVSFITIFEGECLFLFVLQYYVDKKGIDCKATKLDNDYHSAT